MQAMRDVHAGPSQPQPAMQRCEQCMMRSRVFTASACNAVVQAMRDADTGTSQPQPAIGSCKQCVMCTQGLHSHSLQCRGASNA
eukprot:1160400-Pelagomonas_calceolata.AAC.2